LRGVGRREITIILGKRKKTWEGGGEGETKKNASGIEKGRKSSEENLIYSRALAAALGQGTSNRAENAGSKKKNTLEA